MSLFALDTALLAPLLEDWRLRLSAWAQSGALSRAAMEALRLPEEPVTLRESVERWAAGDWRELPPVEVVPASAMPTAAGAYALATDTIYLNQSWLEGASREAALAVLTEELGHHLDGLLNSSDTPGDEGEMLAALLLGGDPIDEERRQALLAENDQGSLWVGGNPIAVEQAGRVGSISVPPASPGRTRQEFRSFDQFVALRSDGSVVTWGGSQYTQATNKTITSWRPLAPGETGGRYTEILDLSELKKFQATQVFSNWGSFAVLNSDGSVSLIGEAAKDSSFLELLRLFGEPKVTRVFSTPNRFAFVRSDNTVVSSTNFSGIFTIKAAGLDKPSSNSILNIYSNMEAFAALRGDGSVNTWGPASYGGDSSYVDFDGPLNNLRVHDIVSTYGAFAALRSDGSVVTWGSGLAANSNFVDFDGPKNNLKVLRVFANEDAFAALRNDGSVVTWGGRYSGGKSGEVDFDGPMNNLQVVEIFSSSDAFAALRSDGSVVAWGSGGEDEGDTSSVDFDGPHNNLKVTKIFATREAFAALRSDGSVVSWGDIDQGGDSSDVDFDGPHNNLRVINIFSTETAFAALRSDGSVVCWGDIANGADTTGVDFDGPDNTLKVTTISTTASAFAALRSDGSVVTWGDRWGGGDSRGVDLSSVVAIADPFQTIQYSSDPILPGISLSASGSPVFEDGSGKLEFTFFRNGPSTSALNVLYSVSGTATAGVDYAGAGIDSSSANKVVTFAPGESMATVTVYPVADVLVEPDETIVLTLVANSGYSILTTTPVVNTIRNDDAIIENKGKVSLLRRSDGQALVQVGSGPNTEITSPWGATIGSDASTWQILAVDTLAGVNQVLWRNNASNVLQTWTLDANWSWIASNGSVDANSTAGWALESNFQVDANGDGTIGIPFSTVESQGNTGLLRRGDGVAFVNTTSVARQQIRSPWGANIGSNSSSWQILAAETIGGVNQLLWRSNTANLLHTWNLDSSWNWTASNGVDSPDSAAGWALEVDFQVDANGDGLIGTPYFSVETQGNTALLRRGDGQAFIQVGTGPRTPITSPWGAAVGSDTTPWQILAADNVAGVNQLLWRNNSSNFLHAWALDADWNWTFSGGTFDPNAPSGWDMETDFQVDANNDSIIGAPFSTVETRGTTTLLRRGDGQAFVQVGAGPRTPVTSPWGAAVGSDTTPWQIIAADTIGGVNQLLWRNNSANILHTWSLDANWNWTSANGTFAPTSPQGLALLSQFGLS